MKSPDEVMENLIRYLYSTIHTLLECVNDEKYEIAAALRDEIEFYIINTCRYLIQHKLVKTNFDEIYFNIIELKLGIITEVSEMMDIPKEKRILI